MKKTFATTLPDQVGAFMKADACIARLGLNIVRVSYNKAVDQHMLFLEVEGSHEELKELALQLKDLGYLPDKGMPGSVLLLEYKVREEPGALQPVLQLIDRFHFNITYISSQETGGDYQYFKMGLYVEDSRAIAEYMRQAALICPIKVLHHDKSEKLLDNTVFYLSFAEEISSKMALSDLEKRRLVINANAIMQMLDEQNHPPHKTFEFIGRFAEYIQSAKGEGFVSRITRHQSACGLPITLIEPPCGSNMCVMAWKGQYLVADTGFPCYREELQQTLLSLFPDFFQKPRTLFLSHADVDHCACTDWFDEIYVNQSCLENFRREQEGLSAFRENSPAHAPYALISKIIIRYQPPNTENFCVIGARDEEDPALLSHIGHLDWGPLHFAVYEGKGGHVRGEGIYIDWAQHLAFTGDLFVNLKDMIPRQAEFNRIAPYLMTSVDTDPALAKAEREGFFAMLTPGHWQIFGGHGGVYEIDIP